MGKYLTCVLALFGAHAAVAESYGPPVDPEWCIKRKFVASRHAEVDRHRLRVTHSAARAPNLTPYFGIMDESDISLEGAFSDDATQFWVGHHGEFSLFSTDGPQLLYSVQIGSKPHYVHWGRHRNLVLANINEPGTFGNDCLFVFDLERKTVAGTYPVDSYFWSSALLSNDKFLAYAPATSWPRVLDVRTGAVISKIEDPPNADKIVADHRRVAFVGDYAVEVAMHPGGPPPECSVWSDLKRRLVRTYFDLDSTHVARLEETGEFWHFAFGRQHFAAATAGGRVVVSDDCSNQTSLHFDNDTVFDLIALQNRDLFVAAVRRSVVVIDARTRKVTWRKEWTGVENVSLEEVAGANRILVFQEDANEDSSDEYLSVLDIADPTKVKEIGQYYYDEYRRGSHTLLLEREEEVPSTVRELLLLDLRNGRDVRRKVNTKEVALDPHGKYVAALTGNQIEVFHTATGKAHFSLEAAGARGVQISGDGSMLLVSGSESGASVRRNGALYSLAAGRLIANLVSEFDLYGLQFSPTSDHVLGSDGKVWLLWQVPR